MEYYLFILAIAVFSGFSSGMFGIGGSIVATPLLCLFLGMEPEFAVATPLAAAIPSAISGSVKYAKEKLINFRLAGIALISAIPFGILGTYVNDLCPGKEILIIKAMFLLALGLRFFVWEFIFKTPKCEPRISIAGGLLSGAAAGFVAGFIAVGGGIVLVTAFLKINRVTMKEAIASSLFCVGILAVINSAGHFLMGHTDPAAALLLGLFVIPFSYLGAKTAVKISNLALERIFGIFMIIFAIYFIILQIWH